MEPKPGNNPYANPAEMAKALNLPIEEAESLFKQWSYKAPTDLDELAVHANKASRYEHGMRGLNTDRREGDLTEAQYAEEERKLKKEIYGD